MVRILRPSRPIIRPFISSLGIPTTDTVLSLVVSLAYFCIAIASISFAVVCTAFLARSSSSLMYVATSSAILSLTAAMIVSLACSLVNPDIAISLSSCSLTSSSTLLFNCSICSLRKSSFCSLDVKDSSRLSKYCDRLFNESSLDAAFSSNWTTTARRSRMSASASLRKRCTSCFASKTASLFNFSASFFPSSTIFSVAS